VIIGGKDIKICERIEMVGKIERHMEETILEKIRCNITQYVSKRFLDDLQFEKIEDEITGRMIYLLKCWVWGKQVCKTVEETTAIPLTWWDAFKERWFPNFLQKRFPIKYKTINTVVRHFHVCPHINQKTTGSHLTFLTSKPIDIEVFRDEKNA